MYLATGIPSMRIDLQLHIHCKSKLFLSGAFFGSDFVDACLKHFQLSTVADFQTFTVNVEEAHFPQSLPKVVQWKG